ncbi:MAG: peroxiredoxin [Flammeovirgaceae bacterium]|jgi:peroxiredoxin
MKKIYIFLLSFILIACGNSEQATKETNANSEKEVVVEKSDISVGNYAPDFRLQKLNSSEKISLVDLKGKYVLIDFWASWCGPCRMENPNVKRVYEKFSKDEFEIISVSIDTNEIKWKKAVEQDGLPWLNVIDTEMTTADRYGVSAIPFTVLIDKEGKILATNLRGEILEVTLDGIFGV